jgi:hypothetical protein
MQPVVRGRPLESFPTEVENFGLDGPKGDVD